MGLKKAKIFRFSLAFSLIGISLLLFLSQSEPALSPFDEIKGKEGTIKVRGRIIKNKKITENFYILTLKNKSGSVEVLVDKNITLQKVEVIGRLDKYKNKTQIQATKIIPI